MGKVLIGPMLRFVGEDHATIWMELDRACEVEILGEKVRSFEVKGHHYALIALSGLEPGVPTPYEVHLDGRLAWPPQDYDYPAPRIRTIPRDADLKLLFGSCRASAPHHPPYTYQRWWNSSGRGQDALRAFGKRMIEQPSAMWPDALLMLGDQIYADQPPPRVCDAVAPRRVSDNGPVDVLEDFEEYTVGYRDAWTYPVVRWLLSNLPSSMIFDDHEINDMWKTSDLWLKEKRQTDWYETRVHGGLMAYWLYQHLGNLSPDELEGDETFCRVREGEGDQGELVRELAHKAESQPGHSRFSFHSDWGPARVLMLDSRAGRHLEPGKRRIMDEDEWDWVVDHVDHDHKHLIIGSSLPIFLPTGMHGIEAWCEALGDGAWGKRFVNFAEKVRIGASLDHWACFQASFREFEELVVEIATGKCGGAPRSLVVLGGDVHHCFISEVSLPEDAGPASTQIWQVVCSGVRKELQLSQRLILALGHTRLAAGLGKGLARSARVRPPRLRWRETTRPNFRNQIGTLEIAGDEVGVRLERVGGSWRHPTLRTVIEQRLA